MIGDTETPGIGDVQIPAFRDPTPLLGFSEGGPQQVRRRKELQLSIDSLENEIQVLLRMFRNAPVRDRLDQCCREQDELKLQLERLIA